MKPGWGVGLALLTTACGGGGDGNDIAPANGAVAEAAPPTHASLPVTPATSLPAGEGIPGVSAPPPAERPGPAPEPAAPVEPGAAAAVAVLRDYFAALQGARYADAYRLWGDGGQAAGIDAASFADSYRKYADYRATLGTPGRIDAGAGQRYIDIPVRVVGRLRDGTPVVLEGPVTLHRTGDIDGATAEQRSWRLSASGLKPRPG